MEVVREFLSTLYIIDNEKVLLTWNKKVKMWIPLGGHIEKNELPCDSVIREAKEESGLNIELVSAQDDFEHANLIQPIHMHLDKIKEDHEHINLGYIGKVIGGKLLAESDEQTPLKWFSREDLEKENLVPDNVKETAFKALDFLTGEK